MEFMGLYVKEIFFLILKNLAMDYAYSTVIAYSACLHATGLETPFSNCFVVGVVIVLVVIVALVVVAFVFAMVTQII
jgi:hypothetical protein